MLKETEVPKDASTLEFENRPKVATKYSHHIDLLRRISVRRVSDKVMSCIRRSSPSIGLPHFMGDPRNLKNHTNQDWDFKTMKVAAKFEFLPRFSHLLILPVSLLRQRVLEDACV